MKAEIYEVLRHYSNKGEVSDVGEYGNGHINDTYLVSLKNGDKIILQCINKSIFKEPEKLMENIAAVTVFLKGKIIKLGGDPSRETLNIVKTDDDEFYFKSSLGDIWRAYEFVRDAICYEQVKSAKDFYEAGCAFGNFQNLLSDFPVETLHEIIPDFHNNEARFSTFKAAVKEDALGRGESVKDEIEFFTQRESYTHIFNDALRNGEINLRVTHNDTKLNNILFDKYSDRAMCVIDLDTIMPGIAAFDFGDAIRFGANTGLEDERDLSKVSLGMEQIGRAHV